MTLMLNTQDDAVVVTLSFIEPTPEVVAALEAADIAIDDVMLSYTNRQSLTYLPLVATDKANEYVSAVAQKAVAELGTYVMNHQAQARDAAMAALQQPRVEDDGELPPPPPEAVPADEVEVVSDDA